MYYPFRIKVPTDLAIYVLSLQDQSISVTASLIFCFCLLGCEDIIAESISLDTLIAILKWSSQPYGSKWVHRQALHFLCEEFTQVMTSDVFYELSKDHLLTAIQSDYLQVTCMQNTAASWFPMMECVNTRFPTLAVEKLHK